MKKKILVAAVAGIVAAGAALSFNQNSKENALSDLALSNIEALANNGEGGIPNDANCSTAGPYKWCYRIYIKGYYFDTFWIYPHA